MKTIYYYGSERRDKVIPALSMNYNVNSTPETIKNLRLAVNRVRRQPPSLLIIDTANMESGILAWVAKRKKIPYIVRQRGGMWGELRDKDNWNYLLKVVKFSIRNLIIRRANATVTVSEFLKEEVSTKLQNGELPRITTIHNIVLPEKGNGQAFRKKLGISPNSKIILTITSFTTYKKYAAILDFAGSIMEILIKNEDWCWIILGKGYAKGKIENELYQVSPILLAERRIIFGGYYGSIWDAYAAAEILVQMSYRETMGNPLLEAQSVGKIALCNNFGGMPELLRGDFVYHNRTELLFKLNNLVTMPNESRTKLGNELKKDMKLFSKEHIAELWRTEIEKVLGDY